MAKCDVCGNDYDKAFQVVSAQGSSRTFDSFECAIHALAPTCAPLPVQDHWARHRGARHILLLRALCQGEWRFWRRRSRVATGPPTATFAPEP
jgi:hypothetical protein